jgi:lipopolysaccharide transport system ATP-binding protein
MDTRPIIQVTGIGKRYAIGAAVGTRKQTDAERHIWALRDINFSVQRGERVGIIGRNGAGKSTLLKILSRVIYPTEGEARIRGRLTALLEVGSGFSDTLTGRENIFLNAKLHGLDREQVLERLDQIIEFSELGKFIDTQIKYYSSGMRARLGFAVAAHLNPDILVLDEVLAVGDMAFQRKCLERMEEVTSEGRTLLFVSHTMDSVARFCDRCIWLEHSRIRADGDVASVTSAYAEAMGGTTSRIERQRPERIAPPVAASAEQTADAAPMEEGAASLLSATIINARGETSNVLPLHEPIGISFEFEVLGGGVYVPAIALYGPDKQLLFWSVPKEADTPRYRLELGDNRAEVWLPSHLLNVGAYSVTLAVVGPDHTPMKRYVLAERALSFQTVDPPFGTESARGLLTRDFPGGLRPLLDWRLEQPRHAATHAEKAGIGS